MEGNYNQPPLQPQTSTPTSAPAPKHKLNKANIVMAILLVLALAAAITFAVLWATKKTDAPAEDNNASSTETTQIGSTTDCQTASVNQQSSDKECTCPELTFSEDAIVNKQENITYSASYLGSFYATNGPIASTYSHGKVANMYINWGLLDSIFVPGETASDQSQAYEIEFSSNIADIMSAHFSSQSAGYEVFLFLLEDGTVEYMPLRTVYKTREVKSSGKLAGLSNIEKLYQGSSNITGSTIGGNMTAFAQTSDGKIYQLYTILDEAGAWN